MSATGTALLMAGGRSERMRASRGSPHKALVPILGVSMIERNLCTLLSEQFEEIWVAYNAHESGIERYLETRGRYLVRSRGASLELIREDESLGTIGAAGRLKSLSGPLLVLNVDNLTTIPLQSLATYHRKTSAALTIAVHREPFRIPFGAVTVGDGEIVSYTEKPVYPVAISSGVYVLSSEARALIPEGARFDLPDLFSMLSRGNGRVAAFEHSAAWIDINDAAAVSRAEQLVLDQYEEFELWKIPPDGEIRETFFYEGRRVARAPVEIGCEIAAKFVAAFDELCVPGGRLIRHNMFVLPAADVQLRVDQQRWISLDRPTPALGGAIDRCLAVLRHRI